MRIALRPVVLTALMSLGGLAGCQKAADTATSVTAPISPPSSPAAQTKAAGLWTERVSDGGGVHVVRYCLDEASAAQFSALAGKLSGRCTSQDMVPSDAGGWRFASQCDMGAWGKVSTAGVVHGAPPERPVIDALTRTAGSSDAQRRLKVEIRWQKDCPKNIAPGEVVWPDGRRSRLSDFRAPS